MAVDDGLATVAGSSLSVNSLQISISTFLIFYLLYLGFHNIFFFLYFSKLNLLQSGTYGTKSQPFFAFFLFFLFSPKGHRFHRLFPGWGCAPSSYSCEAGWGGRGAGGGHPFFLPLGTLGLAQSWILSDANFR